MLQDLADKGFLTEAAGGRHERPDRCEPARRDRRPRRAGGAAARSRRPSAFRSPCWLELTHRCPLQCPYCSNPVELERASGELTTAEWKKVLTELAEIGVLQVHFSGGEPTARKDLVELVQHASDVGLYTNLITSAVLLTREQARRAGRCRARATSRSASRATKPALADRVARLQERRTQEARSGEMDARAGPAAHRECGDAPAEPAPARRHHPDGGRSRRRPARGRQRAVLRLGAEEPRRADADRRAARRDRRASSRRRAAAEGHARPSTTSCRTITRCGRRSAWAAGAGSSSTSRRPARSCPATPPRPSPASTSNRCAPTIRSPGSGRTPRPSTAIAAPAGCRSRARAASSRRSISAAAAARPSR